MVVFLKVWYPLSKAFTGWEWLFWILWYRLTQKHSLLLSWAWIGSHPLHLPYHDLCISGKIVAQTWLDTGLEYPLFNASPQSFHSSLSCYSSYPFRLFILASYFLMNLKPLLRVFFLYSLSLVISLFVWFWWGVDM